VPSKALLDEQEGARHRPESKSHSCLRAKILEKNSALLPFPFFPLRLNIRAKKKKKKKKSWSMEGADDQNEEDWHSLRRSTRAVVLQQHQKKPVRNLEVANFFLLLFFLLLATATIEFIFCKNY
jgi:hypothetical protein